MKYLYRFLLVMASLSSACSDQPTAAECEAESGDPDACRAIGCLSTSATPTTEVEGQCIADTLTTDLISICVYVEESRENNAPFFYFRTVDGEVEVRLFNSDHGEISGWERCENDCGCESTG